MSTGSPPPTPRWVKVFAIVILIAALLLVGLLLFSGGAHGPQRHGAGPATAWTTFRVA